MPAERAALAVSTCRERASLGVFWAVLAVVVVAHAAGGWDDPAVSASLTVFVAICVQASPYVTLGVLAAAGLRHLPERVLGRLARLPPSAGVPTLALSGALLPGCECGSVGVASALLRRGVCVGPTFAFMMSAPSTNPVVVVATVAAFPGRPGIVVARVAGSVLAALALGWCWPRLAGSSPPPGTHAQPHDTHDLPTELVRSLGLLVLGAGAAACVTVLVPPRVVDSLSSSPVVAVIALACAAVLMSVCSAADAFVAASFTRFSATAQLVFMIVGPVVDLKLIAMYLGTFGRAVLVRFVPLALAATVGGALAAGAGLDVLS